VTDEPPLDKKALNPCGDALIGYNLLQNAALLLEKNVMLDEA
jgi:hypothetical protein